MHSCAEARASAQQEVELTGVRVSGAARGLGVVVDAAEMHCS